MMQTEIHVNPLLHLKLGSSNKHAQELSSRQTNCASSHWGQWSSTATSSLTCSF